MRRIALAAVSISALAAATSAHADEWWLFSRTQSAVTFIDFTTLSTANPQKPTIWMRRFEPEMMRSLHGRAVLEFAEHWQADCAARRATILEGQLYDRDGAEIAQGQGDGAWISADMGTNAELLVQVLCDHDRVELDPVAAQDLAGLKALVLGGTLRR